MNKGNRPKNFLMLLLCLFLAGCGGENMTESLGIDRLDQTSPTPMPKIDFSYVTLNIPDVTAAIKAYNKGQPDVASGLINRAIQSFPLESELHYTNGLIYLGWSEIGFPQYRQLGEIALGVAIQLDPANIRASEELGNVFLERHAFRAALVTLAHAANQNSESRETLEALAAAAYYDSQFSIARWAVDSLLKSGHASDQFYPLMALVYAANGDVHAATNTFEKYVASDPGKNKLQHLSRAIAEWRAIHQARALQVSQPVVDEVQQDETSDASTTIEPSDERPGPATLSKRWDSCEPREPYSPRRSQSQSTSSSSSRASAIMSAHTIKPERTLKALPSPCADGPMPRMVFIDVVIINVDVLSQESHGINLLNHLELVATGGITKEITTVAGQKMTSSSLKRSLSLPQSGIQYSLNISNAAGHKSEIIARPTLVAMDRRPSYFENGESLFLGIPGQYSGSSLYEIQAGLELAVIPTFIDDDTILLAVEASRAFFQDMNQAIGTFSEQLLSLKNTVSVNVEIDMGKSLILSGLVQRLKQRNSDGVPTGGKDIPGLSQRTIREATSSIIFILTPRRAYASSPRDIAPSTVFSEAESIAYEQLLIDLATKAGLNPAEDVELADYLTITSRDVVFSRQFLSPIVSPVYDPK